MTADNTYHEKLMFIDFDIPTIALFFSLFEKKIKSSLLYLTSPHFIKFLEIETPPAYTILFDIPPIHSRRNNRYFNSVCLGPKCSNNNRYQLSASYFITFFFLVKF